MLKGPLVELSLRVGNISRGHAPFKPDAVGFTLDGTLQSEASHSWFDKMLRMPPPTGAPVLVFFEGTVEEDRLLQLRPGESVAVAGYATLGLPGVYYESDYDRLRAAFGLSQGRFL